MQAWDALASVLVGAECFSRAKLSGKNAQSRSNQLLQACRSHNTNVASLAGVNEDVSEKDVLLDKLIELLDDAENAQEQKKRKERDDAASLVVRRLAMERMERGDLDINSSNKKRKSRSWPMR